MIKNKLITIGLITMTVFLIGAIFYFSYLLMETPSGTSTSSAIAPKKTKAQVDVSEKFIALNQSNDVSPTTDEMSIISPSPTVEPTVSLELTASMTPTPTEVLLAKADNSPTPSVIESEELSASPTKIESLLSSGYFNYSLVIFGMATFLIFYSLIF